MTSKTNSPRASPAHRYPFGASTTSRGINDARLQLKTALRGRGWAEQAAMLTPRPLSKDHAGDTGATSQVQMTSSGESDEKVLQSPAWFLEQQKLGRFEGMTKEEFFAEFLAKNLAYKHPDDYTDYDREMLKAWGYEVPNIEEGDVVMNEHGLFVARFDPDEDHEELSSQIAFRGTGTEDLDDAYADLNPEIGASQYDASKEEIAALISGGQGDEIGLSGHSLGGALASKATADHAAGDEDRIKSLTTFQGAGVSEHTMEKFAEHGDGIDVNHYQVSGDIVHRAGDGQLAGEFHTLDVEGLDLTDLAGTQGAAHRGYMNYDPHQDPANKDAGLLTEGDHRWVHSDKDPVSKEQRERIEEIRRMTGAGLEVFDPDGERKEELEAIMRIAERGPETMGKVTDKAESNLGALVGMDSMAEVIRDALSKPSGDVVPSHDPSDYVEQAWSDALDAIGFWHYAECFQSLASSPKELDKEYDYYVAALEKATECVIEEVATRIAGDAVGDPHETAARLVGYWSQEARAQLDNGYESYK